MSATAPRASSQRAGNGGVAARRAVTRWAWRMFRREWRHQALVLALLTGAIAVVLYGATAAYDVVPSGDADFGTANARIALNDPNPAAVRSALGTAQERFGTIDVIVHREVPVAGSADTVELRAQDPRGAYGASMLALRSGRYPRGANEVALTGGLADTLRTAVGKTVELGGARRTVVGRVENPANLDDEFALVPASALQPAQSVTVLIRSSGSRCTACRGVGGTVEVRGTIEKNTAAAVALGLATVALLLVCLVAAAGFVVVAQRRARQLGMLGAIGATDAHLRLVMVVNGVVVGAIAAIAGAALGLAAWIATSPRLEHAAGHRIDRFDVPWWVVIAGMALGVVTATVAAWWPARSAARMPIIEALSARPPRPKPVHRSALAGVVCAVAGFASIATGINTARDRANPLFIFGGIVAVVLAVLLLSPIAIRALGRAGERLPVAARLAVRDLARYQARSAAALAAIGVGLAIAVAVVVLTTVAIRPATAGNLSDRQMLLRVADAGDDVDSYRVDSNVELDRLGSEVARFAAATAHATVAPFDVAVQADSARAAGSSLPAAVLVRRIGAHSFTSAGMLYLGTPDVLRAAGVRSDAFAGGVDVLTSTRGAVFVQALKMFVGNVPDPARREPARLRVGHIASTRYSSAPHAFVNPATLPRLGLAAIRGGWLVETSKPLTSEQRAAAHDLAARTGMTLETRDPQHTLSTTRTAATAGGMLLALGILAMTVGLIRSEAGRDLRTLTAAGATSRARRTLTAVTAGSLALLGVLLGAAAAYLVLFAAYLHQLGRLGHVPTVPLVVTVVGIPLVSALAGWLVSGREPSAVARTAFD